MMTVAPTTVENGEVNYVANPGAESGTTGWLSYATAGFTVALAQDSTQFVSGANSFRLDVSANTAAVGGNVGIRQINVPIPATTVFKMEAKIRTTNPNLVPYLYLEAYSSLGGTYLGSKSFPAPSSPIATNVWAPYAFINDGFSTSFVGALPTTQDMTVVNLYIMVRSLQTGATGSLYFDDIHLGVVRKSLGGIHVGSLRIGPLRVGKA